MSGQRTALIVANDEYDHDGLGRLLVPGADAEALGRVLADPQIGGFEVEVVRNQPAHVVSGRVEEVFADSSRDDVLLLHFSCHGLKSESGELFFAARNTRPNRLGSTAVAADFVQRCMRTSRSRSIVLLLDCCYGGAFAQGVAVRASGDVNVLDSFPVAGMGGGRGRAVITASNAMEYAFEADALADDHTLRPSVFTAAVVDGLATGDADRDEDGWVSLNELYDYVFDRVKEQNPNQTPSRDVEMQGELYVARSRRRRIRGRPIPPDLEAARTASDMYTRIGAVSELASRLASDNLEVAVGAYEGLADTANTDIDFVADRARAAIRQVSVQPVQTDVHFGQLEQGSPSPQRTITLVGPPIARAVTPQTSDDWIRATHTTEAVEISLDMSRTGVLRGTVELTGPTGDATVTIHVELVAPRTSTAASISTPAHNPTSGQDAAPPSPVDETRAEPEPATRRTNPFSQLGASPSTAPHTPPSPGTDASEAAGRAKPEDGLTAPRDLRFIWNLWALTPLLSGGFLTPVTFIIAARRLRERRLRTIAVVYSVAWLTIIIAAQQDPNYLWWMALLGVVGLVHAQRLYHRVTASIDGGPDDSPQ